MAALIKFISEFLRYMLAFLSLFPFQDLGLQGTSLNDILYKNAAFLNLVDPISHELLLSLARDLQCPKRVRKQSNHSHCIHLTGGFV